MTAVILALLHSSQSFLAGFSFLKPKGWQKWFNLLTKKYYTVIYLGLILWLMTSYYTAGLYCLFLALFWAMGWSRWLGLSLAGNFKNQFDTEQKKIFDVLIPFKPKTHLQYRLYGTIGYFYHTLTYLCPFYIIMACSYDSPIVLWGMLSSIGVPLSYFLAGFLQTEKDGVVTFNKWADPLAKLLSGLVMGAALHVVVVFNVESFILVEGLF
jgi:hypothetical protein